MRLVFVYFIGFLYLFYCGFRSLELFGPELKWNYEKYDWTPEGKRSHQSPKSRKLSHSTTFVSTKYIFDTIKLLGSDCFIKKAYYNTLFIIIFLYKKS